MELKWNFQRGKGFTPKSVPCRDISWNNKMKVTDWFCRVCGDRIQRTKRETVQDGQNRS